MYIAQPEDDRLAAQWVLSGPGQGREINCDAWVSPLGMTRVAPMDQLPPILSGGNVGLKTNMYPP